MDSASFSWKGDTLYRTDGLKALWRTNVSSTVVGRASGGAEKTSYSGLDLLLQASLLTLLPTCLVLNVAMRNLEESPLQDRREGTELLLILTCGILFWINLHWRPSWPWHCSWCFMKTISLISDHHAIKLVQLLPPFCVMWSTQWSTQWSNWGSGEEKKTVQEHAPELGIKSRSFNSTERSPTLHKWNISFWACKQVY